VPFPHYPATASENRSPGRRAVPQHAGVTKPQNAISVELLADHPELIAPIGHMTWQEWGYGAKDPEPFIKVIA
jgi:hypothetical protein